MSAALTARKKLLIAARETFAQEGLHRATTRGIAEAAGVNEVTLFRHFGNKEGLLQQVLTWVVEEYMQESETELDDWSKELRGPVLRFVQRFYQRLERDEALIRTMIGEGRRHAEHARRVIYESMLPVHTRMVQNLTIAQHAGLVRSDLNLDVAADTLTSMLLGGMLHMTTQSELPYSADQYLEISADIFIRGLQPH